MDREPRVPALDPLESARIIGVVEAARVIGVVEAAEVADRTWGG